MVKKTKLTTIEISRKRWLRGKDRGYLRDRKGQQCCLGFVARQAGLTAKEITGKEMPAAVCEPTAVPELLQPLVKRFAWSTGLHSSELADELATLNDEENLPDTTRECRLKKLAKQAGYNFVFVD